MGRSKVIEDLQGQTVVPDIWNNVLISRYMDVAARMFDEAMVHCLALTFQYVSLKRFLNFVTKVYNHNGYNVASNMRRRAWMKRAVRDAMKRLESVAKALEEEEKTKQEEFLFDMLEDEMHAPPGVHSVLDTLAPTDKQKSIEAEELPRGGVGSTFIPPKAKKTLAEIYDRLRIPDAEVGGGGVKKGSSVTTTTTATATTVSNLLAEYDGLEEVQHDAASAAAMEESRQLGLDFPGVSMTDAQVLRHIPDIFDVGLSIAPYVTTFEVLGGLYHFLRDDYHVSFQVVLDSKSLSPDLQISRPAVETNRCFFLHIGIAVGMHPFALQVAFRHMAATLLQDKKHEDASLMQDILPSVLQYAGFVDANACIFLWPQEFANFRLCFLSGNPNKPLVSCFSAREADPATLVDVLIYCDGSHFTLLRPMGSSTGSASIVPALVADARVRQCIVQEHRVPTNPHHSIWDISQRVTGNL